MNINRSSWQLRGQIVGVRVPRRGKEVCQEMRMTMALGQENQIIMKVRMRKKSKEAGLGNEGGQPQLAAVLSFPTNLRMAQPGSCMAVEATRALANVENGDDPQWIFIYRRHPDQQVRLGYDGARYRWMIGSLTNIMPGIRGTSLPVCKCSSLQR